MSEALLNLLRPFGASGAGNTCNKGNNRLGTPKGKDWQSRTLLHARNTAEKPCVTGPSSRGPRKSGHVEIVTRVTPVTRPLGRLHVEFEERAAILEYDGGLSRFEAERAAAETLGYPDAESLFAAVAHYWMLQIDEAETCGDAGPLVADARRFVTVWGSAAASLGVDEARLFGVVPLPPEGYRLANTGLVPLLKGGRVTALTREVATVLAIDGSLKNFELWNLNHEGRAVPFWALPPENVVCLGGSAKHVT